MIAGIDFLETGQGPVVICLHGIGGAAESFLAQMPGGFAPPSASRCEGLAPRAPRGISGQMTGLEGFRVISWNMPGYGQSDVLVDGPSFAGLSEALGRFVSGLDAGPVHLIGQSIGGMVALEHAARCPEQVTSLSLIGTTPSFGGRDDSFREAFLKARLAPLEAGQSMAEMAYEAAPRIVGPDASSAVVGEVADIMAGVSEPTWRGILECLVTFNRRDDLGGITQPCCLIAGTHDQNAPARTMEKMAAKLPVAEYHLIEAAGHMINQEAPEETNAILLEFLRKNTI